MLCGGVAVVWGLVDVMQNCWMFASWPCIAARLEAWLFIDSWVAAYTAPKFNIVLVYNVINGLLLITVMP